MPLNHPLPLDTRVEGPNHFGIGRTIYTVAENLPGNDGHRELSPYRYKLMALNGARTSVSSAEMDRGNWKVLA